MNTWALALKEYNKDKAKWTIPKKGTKEYNAVKALQSKNLKGSGGTQSRQVRPEPEEPVYMFREFKEQATEEFPFAGLEIRKGEMDRLVRDPRFQREVGTTPKTPRRPQLTMSEPEIIDIQPLITPSMSWLLEQQRASTRPEIIDIGRKPFQALERIQQKSRSRQIMTRRDIETMTSRPSSSSRRDIETMTSRPSSARSDVNAMIPPPISSIINTKKWTPAKPWNNRIYVPKI